MASHRAGAMERGWQLAAGSWRLAAGRVAKKSGAVLATVPPTRSSFLSLRYSVYLVSNHRPSTLGYLKLKPRNEDGVINEGVSYEQVSIGRYPRQRKWRARASLLARGASRRRRARVAPASRPRRVQLAAGEGPSIRVSELRPPSRESPSLASRANGPSRHQSWRDSSPKVARLDAKVADFVADSPEQARR
jgi:hypothetical protein